MKKVSFHFYSENGITLIEILASIVILFILTTSLISIFVQTARINKLSQNKMDATYVAENNMEIVYNLFGSSTDMKDLTTKLTNNNYLQTTNGCQNGTCFGKTASNGKYVFVQIIDAGNPLVNIILKVYKDSTLTVQEAQMEDLLSWNK